MIVNDLCLVVDNRYILFTNTMSMQTAMSHIRVITISIMAMTEAKMKTNTNA